MRQEAGKNALVESYTAPFRLSTFLLYARSPMTKKGVKRPTAGVSGGQGAGADKSLSAEKT